MFIEALFIIDMGETQVSIPKHKHVHTHTHTHNGTLLTIKRNEILPFTTMWMDLEVIMLRYVRKTNILLSLMYNIKIK